MEKSSMTALVSAFSRAYHSKNNKVKIFDDSMAEKFLTAEEYGQISFNMAKGIGYFNPVFQGSDEEALRWIVDNQLSPTPLGRAAYTEKMLENAVRIGTRQYLIIAAGFDTFAWRQPPYAEELQIFEIDHPLTGAEKQIRAAGVSETPVENLHFIQADLSLPGWQSALLGCPDFDRNTVSFCSLLGICYYLTKQDFKNLVRTISGLVPIGSSIVFDYNDEYAYTEKAGERAKKMAAMAGAANEAMRASYSYKEMEQLLADAGFLIYEHLEPQDITRQYFSKYNESNPRYPMTAFDNVNYCLGVKKHDILPD